ncbi:hypothetical protein HKD37_11G031869 [Glycine soja]
MHLLHNKHSLAIMLYDRMDSTRKSSLTLVFLLAFFIIASDMGMKSEAQISPLARCSKDSDCKRYCPTCYQCNCVRRLKDEQKDRQFSTFVEMFKKLHVNIHFAKAIAKMPKYAKFLKEIISNKKKLDDFAIVSLNEECFVVALKKLPPKLKDPGIFQSLVSLEIGVRKPNYGDISALSQKQGDPFINHIVTRTSSVELDVII